MQLDVRKVVCLLLRILHVSLFDTFVSTYLVHTERPGENSPHLVIVAPCLSLHSFVNERQTNDLFKKGEEDREGGVGWNGSM